MTSHLNRLAGAPGGAKAIWTGGWIFVFVVFVSSVEFVLAVNTAWVLTGSLAGVLTGTLTGCWTTTVRAGIPGWGARVGIGSLVLLDAVGVGWVLCVSNGS